MRNIFRWETVRKTGSLNVCCMQMILDPSYIALYFIHIKCAYTE